MRLDRALQLQLMNVLCDRYPAAVTPKMRLIDFDNPATLRNLRYLQEHKLIALGFKHDIDSGEMYALFAIATSDGMDFLEQDGGLTAMLRVTTVRLHADTLRQLLEARITATPSLPEEQKATLLARLRQLPAKSIERLADKLLDQALTKAPDAIEWISTLIQGSK